MTEDTLPEAGSCDRVGADAARVSFSAPFRKCPVTLTVIEVETVISILTDFARGQWDHARSTKSAAIRGYCEHRGTSARDLEAALVKRLYSWDIDAGEQYDTRAKVLREGVAEAKKDDEIQAPDQAQCPYDGHSLAGRWWQRGYDLGRQTIPSTPSPDPRIANSNYDVYREILKREFEKL